MKNEHLVKLCVDVSRGRVAEYSVEKAAKSELAIRTAFENILEGELNYRAWRRHRIEIYEIMEDTLNQMLPDAWNESPFYNQLVEIKNGLLGQKNEYVVDEPSTLVVARFAGNHWDTDRQKLPGKKSFSLETEWHDIRVYDDFERFMLGIVSFTQLLAAVSKALQDDIDSRVYTAFVGAGTYLPSQFNETAQFDKNTLLDLAARVETANQKGVRIAGTKKGLAKLDVESQWISENMKNERHTTGAVRIWEGYNTIVIPQVFARGTYDFKIDDNVLYVLPENYRPIKLFFEGNTRTRELGMTDTHDQTLDYELQTKIGVGVVFEGLFGKYTIES